MSDEGTITAAPAGTKKHPLWSPSIKDIARLANVSHSTVSRALQNSPLVKPHTAEKIRKIARESGYRASAVARGLVTRKTRTIGLVVTTIADPFTSEVVSGIYQAASERGYSVFLGDSGADPEREKRVVQSFAEQRVDGIVVTSSRVGALYLPLLSEMRVPIVLVNDQHPGAFVHSVMIKNFEGARLATNHLIELRHRRIAFIGDRDGYQSDTERFGGYSTALQAAGIPIDEALIARGDGKPEQAMQAMEKLLPAGPTAVFCYNDRTALGAMRAIRMHGLKVPEDISVVGFDDIFLASYTDPPLTTIRQPMRQMGLLAMEGLFQLMSGVESEMRIEVEPELVVRESTARVGLRDFAVRYTAAWNSGDARQVASFLRRAVRCA